MNSKEEKIRITPDMLASKQKRFFTFLIDYIMRFVIIFILGIGLGLMSLFTEDTSYVDWLDELNRLEEILYELILVAIYYIIMETTTGRTIGKYITGTKVLMLDGSKPEADKIIVRTLSRFIPFEPFSFFGSEPKGWHDTLTDTVVVDIKKYEEIKNTQLSLSEIGSDSSEFENFIR